MASELCRNKLNTALSYCLVRVLIGHGGQNDEMDRAGSTQTMHKK